jgi:hypothetical protein
MKWHPLTVENTAIALMIIVVLAILLASAVAIMAGFCHYAFLRLRHLRASPLPARPHFVAVFNAVIGEAKRSSFKGILRVLFENPREGILVFICMLIAGFGVDAAWAIIVGLAFAPFAGR